MTICDFKTVCEAASGLLALGAAAFWFYASWIARGSFLNTPMPELDRSMRLQARYNAIAAILAGLAALSQLAVWKMPVCRAFG